MANRQIVFCAALLAAGCGSAPATNGDGAAEVPDAGVHLDGSGDLDELDLSSTDGGGNPPGAIDLAGADLSPRTIHGTVIDLTDRPVVGFKVTVQGQSVTTDDGGHFTLDAPGGFYDALVSGVQTAQQNAPGSAAVAQYLGLTRSDPTLRMSWVVAKPSTSHTATIAGNISGIAAPLAPGVTGQVASDVDGTQPFVFTPGASALDWVAYPKWNGNATQNTTVRAAFTKDEGVGAFAVVGYGSAAAALSEGMVAAIGPIAITAPPKQNLTLTLQPLANSSTSLDTWVNVGALTVRTVSVTGVSGALSYPQPVIPNATMDLAATASPNAGGYGRVQIWGFSPGSALGTISPPAPGAPVALPGAPSAVQRDADFTVSGGDTVGQVHVFLFGSPGGNWSVVTQGKSVKFPDASAFGVPNPPASARVYGSITEVPSATVDDAAGNGNFLVAKQAVPAGQPFRSWNAVFSGFSFTN